MPNEPTILVKKLAKSNLSTGDSFDLADSYLPSAGPITAKVRWAELSGDQQR